MHPTIPSLLSVTGLLCLAYCFDRSFAGDSAGNVTWITPSDGDTYASGDTIVGRWSSDKAVVSPSFRICVTDDGGAKSRRSEDDSADDEGDDDGLSGGDNSDDSSSGVGDGSSSDGGDGSCGAAVWPTIGQSDGSYFVHMTLPNVSSVASCFLEMVDDFGHKMASPTFSYGATASDTSSSEATNTTASVADAADVSSASSASSPSSPSSPALQTPNTPTPQTLPSLDESHVPVPTAAYAVPLSLVVSVILAACGLSVHQRRKLQTERRQEQESLKTRGAALSRHSTLSFAGFTKLGLGPGGSRPPSSHGYGHGPGERTSAREGQGSRSTSVSMVRGWRRDVSRHERRPECASRASDTTLAWRTDDGGSSGGGGGGGLERYTSLPRREPRRPTREPFHASHGHGHGRARHTTVPARDFGAGVSPIFPSTDSWGGDHDHDEPRRYVDPGRSAHKDRRYARDKLDYDDDDEEDWGRLKRKGRTLVDPGVVDKPPQRSDSYLNASVNDSVLDRYIAGSPVPPSPGPRYRERSPASVSRPERLHVRRYAEADREESALPLTPRDSERDLYDAVARRIARDSHA